MGKVLLYASIAVTLAAAALGIVNKGKLTTAREELTSSQQAVQQKTAALDQSQKELKAANDTLETTTAEKTQALAQVETLKSDLDKNKPQIADFTAQVAAKTTEVTELEAKLKEAETKLANATVGTATVASGPSPEDQARIQELETLNTKLQGDLDSSKAQLDVLVKEKNDRIAVKMRNGMEGRILAVNPAWNFVVMNLGDRQGVVGNAEMLVKRGNQLMGKVRITSVEPSTSIADIVANSVPRGLTIQPGDHVIYQATAE
jgi:ABC-type transporter Mla subunit MlaD